MIASLDTQPGYTVEEGVANFHLSPLGVALSACIPSLWNSSFTTWKLFLTEDTGTQCPQPQSQPAVASTDVGSATLSKSKKKRLRKKKTSATPTTTKEDPTKIRNPVIKYAASSKTTEVDVHLCKKSKSSSKVDLVGKQETHKLPKNTERVDNLVESCTIDLEAAARRSKLEKVEVNSKEKAVQLDREGSTRQKEPQNCTIAIGLTETSRVAMDAIKPTKNDVMAQREAKKLAKAAKKNKSGGGVTLTPAQQTNITPQKTQTPNNFSNAEDSSPVSAVTSQMNQISFDSVDGEIVKAVRSVGHVDTVAKTGLPSGGCGGVPNKSEKSREEILAEREAKKLAKLAAKAKKDVVSEKSRGDQSAAVNDKSATLDLEAVGSNAQKDVKPVGNSGPTEKSKAALRAERRAKQEAQRAAKEGAKKDVENTKPTTGIQVIKPGSNNEKSTPAQKAQGKPQISKMAATKSNNQPKLLSHLLTDKKPLPAHVYQNVHPAIVELGAKYAARVVSGSNARCIALLQALKRVIVDFVTPREKEFSRAIETRLNDSMMYLNACRLISVSMTNALKHVKSHLTQLTTESMTTDDDARKKLCEVIDTFIKEQIDVAGEAISLAVAQKISDGDTIAIYGCSSLLLRILVESHNGRKDFEVVVVDGGPLYEGREMCRRLVSENIKCSYVLLPAFSYIVGQTTKVLLGAHALLANGCVMSRSGTAVVAMLAKAHNVPVIVCCETYKFCERVQADAFVHNELGPEDKVSSPPSISLMYDMTPPTLVDAVATELAILPCTSVPVILRVKPSDVSSYYY
ncbi:hypothetical protein GE061_008086 [Apolygus lucorum]|uniref:Translation initiation factor eIF2B subunit delta n=1 Tax=Apolygus lucorum TaxID=248454 RepID=A0A8S9WQD6_APOLU|nr:hypothetical protein GE061_008086 [Apolygus lucorum]